MKRMNIYADVPGIYHARNRLCDTEKGQMFEGYEKTDANEIYERYKVKSKG